MGSLFVLILFASTETLGLGKYNYFCPTAYVFINYYYVVSSITWTLPIL